MLMPTLCAQEHKSGLDFGFQSLCLEKSSFLQNLIYRNLQSVLTCPKHKIGISLLLLFRNEVHFMKFPILSKSL